MWILIIQEEEKNTCWVLTDVNVSCIVWFEWLWVENTYACDSMFFENVFVYVPNRGCGGWGTQAGALTDMNSPKETLILDCTLAFFHSKLCVSFLYVSFSPLSLSLSFSYLHSFACFCSFKSFLGRWSKGAEALHATHHRARCYCSKSSGPPLGKMRGLITVKLANEQVNYRGKFQCKDCQFSKRSSCLKSLK